MLKHKFTLFAILLLLSAILFACEDSDGSSKGKDMQGETGENTPEQSHEKVTPSNPTSGGTLTGAMFSAPRGMFNPIFYDDAYEANILSFTHESLVSQNENLEFVPALAKSWETNDDQTELILHLEEGVKWHDGEEFTANDVVFTYTSMADPDYIKSGGIRTSFVQPLLGYREFVSGETDEFQGVTAEDDYTVVFKFAEPTINPLYYASFPIIPEHIFANIPVAEMPKAPESLDPSKVIGTGPFQFTEMVEREQYTLERFDDYWQGKPYLDKIIWKVVPHSIITDLLKSGEVDLVANPDGIPSVDYEKLQGLQNMAIIEQPDFSYQLLGFKHNHQATEDVESGAINPENWVPNEKLANPELRHAIAYAINREELIQELLFGHGTILDSPIAKQSWAYDNNGTTNYPYDPDMARAMLDELGYEDTNDDRFRENPDGEDWVINMDYPTGNELREKSAASIEQMLEKVGINVNLRKTKGMAAYVEKLMDDNSDWDLYLMTWGLERTDPDPSGNWRTNATYNFSRWNNPKSDKLIEQALHTPEAFEQDYRIEVYKEWQKLFSEDLPALILYAPNNLWAYNNRLRGVEPLPFTMYNNAHLWWVTDGE